MILLLSLMVALAAEPPPRPAPPLAIAGECSDAKELSRGESRDCLSVSLPLSDVAAYLGEANAYTHLRALYRVDTAELAYKAAEADRRAEWWQARHAEAIAPVRFIDRPSVAVATGVLVGLGTTLLAAKSLQAVNDG